MTEDKIKNLDQVLANDITKGKKIECTKITRLTAPGENFGSVMLKLDITLKDADNGSEEEVYAVAKKIPTQEFMRDLFNVQVTFKNEIAMYDTIVPTLQNFQRENNVNQVIDCFPKFYGARINLGKENGTVDEDAVLLLENLHMKGYQVVERHVGFDFESTQLILKNLAAFHAIPLALKLRKLDLFNRNIKQYLTPFRPPPMNHEEENQAMFIEILQTSHKCIPWIPKVQEIFNNKKTIQKLPPREPFSTVTHGDLWVNNTMMKFESGLPVHNCLLDFQNCDYRSPTNDLFFFLFTSVQLEVLQDHLDDFIEFYHKHFTAHLKALKCDITPFSFPKFLEEMKATTIEEYQHALVMLLFVVFGKKGGPSREINATEVDFEKVKKNISLAAKEKAWYMTEICGKKGWLDD